MTATDPRRVYKSLQAFRGFAACLVLFYHAAPIFSKPEYWNQPGYEKLFYYGGSGVAFFFVLSGFIIFHAHGRDIGDPTRLPRYVYRRFTRIYPAYWVASLGKLGLMLAAPAIAVGGYSAMQIVTAFTLVSFTGNAGILPVAWTLFYEMVFYALFACLIVNKRVGIALFAAWMAIILLRAPLIPQLAFIAEPLNLLFLIGIAVVAIDRRFTVPFPLIIGWSSTVLFLILAICGIQDHFEAVPLGLAAGGAILGFAQAEARDIVSVPKPLVMLGGASYSIYLVHAPLLSILAKLLVRVRLASFLPIPLVFALYAGCAIAGGFAFHYLVERPLLLLFQRSNSRARELVDAAPRGGDAAKVE